MTFEEWWYSRFPQWPLDTTSKGTVDQYRDCWKAAYEEGWQEGLTTGRT